MFLHLVLLSLSLFTAYAIVRTYLPRVPGIVNVAGLLGLGWVFDTYLTEQHLTIIAAASVVAILDRAVKR